MATQTAVNQATHVITKLQKKAYRIHIELKEYQRLLQDLGDLGSEELEAFDTATVQSDGMRFEKVEPYPLFSPIRGSRNNSWFLMDYEHWGDKLADVESELDALEDV